MVQIDRQDDEQIMMRYDTPDELQEALMKLLPLVAGRIPGGMRMNFLPCGGPIPNHPELPTYGKIGFLISREAMRLPEGTHFCNTCGGRGVLRDPVSGEDVPPSQPVVQRIQ